MLNNNKLLRKEKRNGWNDRCKETDNIKDMAKLNQVVDRKEVGDNGLLREDGQEANTLEESGGNILLKNHFERLTEEVIGWINVEVVEWVNKRDVKRVVKQFKLHKNTSDRIKPLVLQNISNKLVDIFRATICMAAIYT